MGGIAARWFESRSFNGGGGNRHSAEDRWGRVLSPKRRLDPSPRHWLPTGLRLRRTTPGRAGRPPASLRWPTIRQDRRIGPHAKRGGPKGEGLGWARVSLRAIAARWFESRSFTRSRGLSPPSDHRSEGGFSYQAPCTIPAALAVAAHPPSADRLGRSASSPWATATPLPLAGSNPPSPFGGRW